MSHSTRCFRYLCSSSSALPKATRAIPPRTLLGARRYAHAALKTRPEVQDRTAPQRIPSRDSRQVPAHAAEEDDFDSPGMSALSEEQPAFEEQQQRSADGKRRQHEWDAPFAEHLNGLFPNLQFPPELARRILTHGSHPAATYGHNAGLSFMGRRVLESYLLLFLTSSIHHANQDVESIISRTISAHVLGEHVGSTWGLGRIMRWTPAAPAHKLASALEREASLRSVGLYKVQGDTVSAVMGGIFYQFGGSVAHRVFHTRVLPSLLLPGKPIGLPDTLHKDALSICERMGGVNGRLLLENADSSASAPERLSAVN